jgi:hypothetical protein
MICLICQTNLPDDAICCYKCGRYTGGAIRQVEPLPVLEFENEEQTVVKPKDQTAIISEEFIQDNERSFANFFKIALLGIFVAASIVGSVAYQKYRENDSNAQIPTKLNDSNGSSTTPIPLPKGTVRPSPIVFRSNVNTANRLPANVSQPGYQAPGVDYPVNSAPTPSQINTAGISPDRSQQKFNAARQLLKNEMLTAAMQSAKNKHPLSRLENCTQNLSPTFQSTDREDYLGIYRCRLKGSILGKNIFETEVMVRGAIVRQGGQLLRSITGTEITSDVKVGAQ